MTTHTFRLKGFSYLRPHHIFMGYYSPSVKCWTLRDPSPVDLPTKDLVAILEEAATTSASSQTIVYRGKELTVVPAFLYEIDGLTGTAADLIPYLDTLPDQAVLSIRQSQEN